MSFLLLQFSRITARTARSATLRVALRLPAIAQTRFAHTSRPVFAELSGSPPPDAGKTQSEESTALVTPVQTETKSAPVEDVKELLPRDVVRELDKYIVGQADAKKAVAIAFRNRWRRHRVPSDLKEEVSFYEF